MVRLGFALRPLDQQPLFSRWFVSLGVIMCRTHRQAGEARSQWLLLPSRQAICCQASAASSRASVLTETGRCVSSRRNRLAGRPRPEYGAGGNGASPGRQTAVLGMIPTA